MKQIIKLEEYTMDQLTTICGVRDEHLKMLEEAFSLEISFRGDELTVEYTDENSFIAVKKIIDALLGLIKKGITITRRDIVYALKLSKKDELGMMEELYTIRIAKTSSGKMIYPKTMGQKTYYYALKKKDVVFGIGPAGTGKTYLAVVFAVDALKNNVVKKIVLTRPAVEAGENLGFLPGDLKEKVDPYLRPIYDALDILLGSERVERYIEKGVIEIAPLAYMRGRTLDDALVILDEAQNTTKAQMLMFLSRLGRDGKMIVNGDVDQIDLLKNQQSGLLVAQDVLKDIDDIGFVNLTYTDIVRHPLVTKILKAFAKGEQNV